MNEETVKKKKKQTVQAFPAIQKLTRQLAAIRILHSSVSMTSQSNTHARLDNHRKEDLTC